MRLTRNILGSVIGLVAALALVLPGGSPAAAAPTAPEAPTAAAGVAVEATDAADETASRTAAGATRVVTTTWTLVDFGPGQEQRICTPPNLARFLYFFVILDGTWSTPIHYGLSDLPAGSEALTGGVVGPGSGDGHTVQAFATFHLGPTPVGRYTPTLWASDGVVTQTVTVIIDVKESCY